jgi:general secretion pathway protein E
MNVPARIEDSLVERELRLARSSYAKGGPAPLDALISAFGMGDDVVAAVERVGGVKVMTSFDAVQADFLQWSATQARASRCLLVRQASAMFVICEDPWDFAAVANVFNKVGAHQDTMVCQRADFESLLALDTGSEEEPHPPTSSDAPGSVVRFVDDALLSAVASGASDIHFESSRQGVAIKYRLDGVLVPGDRLDGAQQAEEVVSRLKVLAKLDITERRLPQDGRFRSLLTGTGLDVRVSVMPSVHGEDVVLRLLDKAQLRGSASQIDLDRLGFDLASAAAIRALAQTPSGLLLVTGPTGSGKTTTVYAALSEINTGLEKIITIEDPVEYELEGVLQVPVNDRKGLTFAKGLRSILRHDPDRLLVGEIRDSETAAIAVQSALTGHLVFTTVHANSVADVIGRFRHFGIDMFGFMSALNGVVVQRLLRKVCDACKQLKSLDHADADWLNRHGLELPQNVVHHMGCQACRGTGYRGRFVVAEVHLVDDVLRDMVTIGAPLSELKMHAKRSGVLALDQQAVDCVGRGVTTLAEVRRVVG